MAETQTTTLSDPAGAPQVPGDDAGRVLEDTPKQQKAARRVLKELASIRTEREHLTARKREVLEAAEVAGLDKKGLERAFADAQLDEEKLAARDHAYLIGRREAGKPVQVDMFTTEKQLAKH